MTDFTIILFILKKKRNEKVKRKELKKYIHIL